jgi:hypothetical protein
MRFSPGIISSMKSTTSGIVDSELTLAPPWKNEDTHLAMVPPWFRVVQQAANETDAPHN